MRAQRFAGIAAIVAGMLNASPAPADVTTYQPMTVAAGGSGNYHDAFVGTTLATPASGQAFGIIGTQGGGGYFYEYLLQFDQLAPWIGGSDKVTNATLTLMFNSALLDDAFTPTPQIQVFRLTNSWVNGATYTDRGGALGNWTTAGGDIDPTPVASLAFPTAPPSYNTPLSWDVTSLVSNWVAGAYPNYGLLLKWDQTTPNRWYSFVGPNGPYYGSQYAAPSLTFTTIPEPSAAVLLAGSVLLAARRRK